MLFHYDEAGIECTGPKSESAHQAIRDLLTKGAHIDGIGSQSYFTMHRYLAESPLRTKLRRFAALGVKVHINELDVETVNVPGAQASRWQAHCVPFQQAVRLCVGEPGCEGISLGEVMVQNHVDVDT